MKYFISLLHKADRHYFHYFPGLVILVFGMLALHSTVLLTTSYRDFNKDFQSYNERLDAVSHAVQKFEKADHDFDYMRSVAQYEVLHHSFMEMNKSIEGLSHIETSFLAGERKYTYQRDIYDLKQNVQSLVELLNDYKLFLAAPDHDVDFGALHEVVERIEIIIDDLKQIGVSHYFGENYSGALEGKAVLLYWSVIAIGLSGFLLTVLNAYRVRVLKNLSDERRDVLRVLEERLAALDQARDGILIIDKDAHVLFLNRALCEILGIHPENKEAALGKTWRDIFARSDSEVFDEDILPVLYEQGEWLGEFKVTKPDYSLLDCELSVTKLPNGGWIITILDMSERKKAQHEKKLLENQFYQAQKMEAIGRLAGGVAHDFNNILAAMNGYAEFLIDDLPKDSEQRKFAKNILNAGMQARDLVDQVLTFSRRSDEKTASTIDVVECVRESSSMLNASLAKSITFTEEIGLERAVINGNATQIVQVIMNLCVNAQDAMEDESGKIHLGLTPRDPDHYGFSVVLDEELPAPDETPLLLIEELDAGRTVLLLGKISQNEEYVCLSVSDNGSGMSRVIMEHIFEPFFTTKSVDKGTGLGLSMVHGIIASHQGFMTIESVLGQGTEFKLYFPVLNSAMLDKVRKNDAAHASVEGAADVRLMLVEDQENVRDMLSKMLERMGYSITPVSSALDALDMIRENPTGYDLVLTDYNMPNMSGLELIEQVSMDLPDLPFVVISGYSEEKMGDMMTDHPSVHAALRKPVSKTRLTEVLTQVLLT